MINNSIYNIDNLVVKIIIKISFLLIINVYYDKSVIIITVNIITVIITSDLMRLMIIIAFIVQFSLFSIKKLESGRWQSR